MLLVYPIREIGRFIVPLLAFFVAGTASGGGWQYLTIVIPVGLGLLRYLTTSFRVAAGRVELRRGLLSRHVLSTPIERVRTVDLTASPIHRVLGLTTVAVGTGTASTDNDEKLDLDGLPVEQRAGAARRAAAGRAGRRRPRQPRRRGRGRGGPRRRGPLGQASAPPPYRTAVARSSPGGCGSRRSPAAAW